MMMGKRFITGKHYATINDLNTDDRFYIGDEKIAKKLCVLLNELYDENLLLNAKLEYTKSVLRKNGLLWSDK